MRTTQAGSSRVDKMDRPIYLRNFTTQDGNRSLYRDLKEDVAGAHGHRSSETVMKRHRQIMRAKTRLLSRSLSLLYVQRNGWPGRQNKKRQLVFATDCETMSEMGQSAVRFTKGTVRYLRKLWLLAGWKITVKVPVLCFGKGKRIRMLMVGETRYWFSF